MKTAAAEPHTVAEAAPASPPLRDRPHTIKLTADEEQELYRRAVLCGKPLARYIRETALGIQPKEAPHRLAREAVDELNRIGVNLNQLTKLAHREGLLEVVEIHKIVVEDLLQAIRRAANQ